ncbi:seven-transmembrane G protein-coupled receptor superfamily [Candidatus Hepatincola sp. Pdp]
MVKCIKNPIFISLLIAFVISITTNILLCLFEFPFFIITVNKSNLSNIISFYSTIIAVLTILITVVLGSSIFYIFTHSKITIENVVKEQLDNKGQDWVDSSIKLKEVIKKEINQQKQNIIHKTAEKLMQEEATKINLRIDDLINILENEYDLKTIDKTTLKDKKNKNNTQGE